MDSSDHNSIDSVDDHLVELISSLREIAEAEGVIILDRVGALDALYHLLAETV